MKTILSILLISSSLGLFSQVTPNINYTYDDAGNRIQRKLYVSNNRMANSDSSEIEASEILMYDISIYPNPTKDKLEVKIVNDGVEANTCQLMIYDIYGREIVNKIQPLTSFTLQLENYKPGIYFVKIIIGEEMQEWKITKN